MAITCTAGVIALPGTVDGIDFAALRNKVVSHHADHVLHGTHVDNTTEDINGPSGNFRVATTGDGDNESDEAVNGFPATRTHNHEIGTLAPNATTQSAGVAPSGTAVTVTGTNGNIECRTIDGYAPEDQWARYEDHWHGVSGRTEETTPSALSIRGVSGNNYQYFYTATNNAGANAGWREVITTTAPHDHDEGNITLAPLNAGNAPTAAGSQAQFDGGNGNVITDGNINGVDVSAFDTHVRNFGGGAGTAGRHNASGTTGTGGSDTAELFSGGNTVYFYRPDTGEWERAWVSASPGANHTHGVTAITGRRA